MTNVVFISGIKFAWQFWTTTLYRSKRRQKNVEEFFNEIPIEQLPPGICLIQFSIFVSVTQFVAWMISSQIWQIIEITQRQSLLTYSLTAEISIACELNSDARIDERKLINCSFVFRGDRQRSNHLFSIICASGIPFHVSVAFRASLIHDSHLE